MLPSISSAESPGSTGATWLSAAGSLVSARTLSECWAPEKTCAGLDFAVTVVRNKRIYLYNLFINVHLPIYTYADLCLYWIISYMLDIARVWLVGRNNQEYIYYMHFN